jgi:tRNA A-37 threonylcarbamoyl transferase component Bud32
MRVGRYVLSDLLGEGGAARVYAAKDERGRDVAIKRLRRPASEDPTSARRLEREADVLRGLDHPGLVRVLDSGRDEEGHSYLALERVDGVSLRDRIAKDGPLDEREAWRIVRATALALRAAHAAGVLHRDLTPSNVLLDTKGRPKLGDFGLARRASDPKLSREGESSGTPAYMAPEQWWGTTIDERTDVYGLGAILYECLTGAPPWQGEPADILHRIATGEPPSVSDHARVRPEVAAFVRRALEREPRGRPTDVVAFIAEGDRAFGHTRRELPYVPVTIAIAVMATPILLGFAGTHDPRAWIIEAGYGGPLTFALAAIGAVLARYLRTLCPIAATLPMLSGALVFFTGMQRVMSGVDRAPAEERFVLFHLGLAEASSGWFLGAACAAALLAAIATWPSAGDTLERPNVRAIAAAVICVGLAIFAAERGAIVVLVIAAVLALVGTRGPIAAISSIAAVGALGLTAWVRLASESARLWSGDLTIAERARELTHLDAQETTVWMVTIAAIAALIACAKWRGLRAWPRARVITLFTTALVVMLALIGPWIASERDRRLLWGSLASHFSVWSELDPPRGAGAPARIGPTLQLGRTRVAVDGEDVAPLASLESTMGALLVAQRLGPKLTLPDEGPHLVLAADRSLPFVVIARALRAAYDLGVRRVDIVQLPGALVRPDPRAPPEARVVLPRDLRAFEIELSIDESARPAGDARFDRVVPMLARERRLRLP